MSDRMRRARQIQNSVMNVSEGVFCVPSQYQDGKAHIVSLEYKAENVLVPNKLLLEAAYLMDPERNNSSAQENEKRRYNLLMAMWNLADEEVRYVCTCPDFKYNGGQDCKHILAVKLNQGEMI